MAGQPLSLDGAGSVTLSLSCIWYVDLSLAKKYDVSGFSIILPAE